MGSRRKGDPHFKILHRFHTGTDKQFELMFFSIQRITLNGEKLYINSNLIIHIDPPYAWREKLTLQLADNKT